MRGGDHYVEVRPLEPLSFDEAKALVVLLGGAWAMPPMSPGVGMMPMRHQVTPLQTLFASLPPPQRQAFLECMDRVWPRNKRGHTHKEWATNWDEAWAASLSAASHTLC